MKVTLKFFDKSLIATFIIRIIQISLILDPCYQPVYKGLPSVYPSYQGYQPIRATADLVVYLCLPLFTYVLIGTFCRTFYIRSQATADQGYQPIDQNIGVLVATLADKH